MSLSYSDHRQNYVDIESASYRTDKQKFISDLFECSAITVSNMVDLNQYNMREERYLQIIRNCKLPDQSMLKKYFAKIYAQLNSVIYDDEKFNDNLGELFMRCDLGNKNTGQFFTPLPYLGIHGSRDSRRISNQRKSRERRHPYGTILFCDTQIFFHNISPLFVILLFLQ